MAQSVWTRLQAHRFAKADNDAMHAAASDPFSVAALVTREVYEQSDFTRCNQVARTPSQSVTAAAVAFGNVRASRLVRPLPIQSRTLIATNSGPLFNAAIYQ